MEPSKILFIKMHNQVLMRKQYYLHAHFILLGSLLEGMTRNIIY
jgi:hypothetical protein